MLTGDREGIGRIERVQGGFREGPKRLYIVDISNIYPEYSLLISFLILAVPERELRPFPPVRMLETCNPGGFDGSSIVLMTAG
jgi:hypothetical protein